MQMYFVALVLPEALNKQITSFKNILFERWNCKVGLKSPAHITFIPPFWMDGKSEEALCHDLNKLCKSIQPFVVTTKNFSAFKPRTIFIEPVLDAALQRLKTAVDAFCKTHTGYGAKTDNRPFHPHITLATRDLHKRDFWEALAYFERQQYEVQFEATGLSVLRHNTKIWEVVHTAPFTTQ